jgi:minor extracellular serine protease Vpr
VLAIGTIWDESEINQALSNNTSPPITNDNGGHGTATTGIISGDASGTESREFKGVAPGAKIISIKFIQDGFPAFGANPRESGFFSINNLDEALQFAHDKIEELGLPSVTLMNFGSIGGPSDGTSLVTRQMDDYIALAHPLVCGVGDDGGNENRAGSTLSQGQTIEIEINKVSSNIRFDLWYEESDRFDVSVMRPNGTIAGPFAAPATANDVNDQFLGDKNIFSSWS